jgi:Fanconi anemia group M protein
VAEEGLDIPSTDLVVFYEPIPSEIRAIQRRGRTGRKMPGNVIILITKDTQDEAYYWAAQRKEKRMRSELELLRSNLGKKFEDAHSFYKEKMEEKQNQTTLTDYQKEGEKQLKIIVDHREYRSPVARNLTIKDAFVEPQQLNTGDYVLSTRIGVERKTVDDYLQSLIDGKLFEQVARLRDAYPRPILIIEGEGLLTKRNISHNAIFGSIVSITVDFGVPIITTKNPHETADLLYVMAKREQRDEKRPIAVRGEKTPMSLREKQQFIVEGLPNVSAVLAKRLLERFGSIKDIVNASEEELREVAGIGKGIASEIVEILNAKYLE